MKLFHISVCWVLIWLLGSSSAANASFSQFSLSGHFEGNNLQGEFKYQAGPAGLSIDYYSSSLGSNLSYTVSKYDECSSPAIYAIPRTVQIAIDGSCSGQGGQIYRYIYEWRKNYSDWCLVREIAGERADITSGTVVPNEHVARVAGCSTIGVSGPYQYETDIQARSEVDDELRKFRTAIGDESDIRQYFDHFPSYSAYELVPYIAAGTVQDINNLAFFLSESGRSYEAIPILKKIVEDFPGRIVAKLNLADAYWDSDFRDLAVQLYVQYAKQMRSSGLQAKIPKRVLERAAK